MKNYILISEVKAILNLGIRKKEKKEVVGKEIGQCTVIRKIYENY